MTTRTSELGDEQRAFLQQRVALFAKVMSVIVFLGGCAYLSITPLERLLKPWFALYLVSAVLFTSTWLACRSGVRSLGFCRGVETIVLLSAAAIAAAQIRLLLPSLLPQMLGDAVTVDEPGYDRVVGLHQLQMALGLLLGLTLMVVIRAAIVPSRTLRTVVLTVPVGVVAGVIMTVGAVPFEGLEPIRSHTPPDLAAATAANFLVWWTMTTVVCIAITRIIYDLRREVRRAHQLGQYTLEEKLGEGGMGTVYRARHAMMRRPTAIKLLPPDKAGEANLARFEREVQLTAQLTHPNTITIFDYGRTPDGVFYYAMELLDGATLDDVVRIDGAQPPGRVLKALAEVASALEEAHGVDFIHRDIKPANIILCRQGGQPDVAKLVDFGLVKDLGGADGVELTSTEAITGTPLYLSPEALTAPDTVDARSDLYSLGAVGYFMLTGGHVFGGQTLVEVCGHHLHSEPEPPSKRLGQPVPADLEVLLLACLAKLASDRPQSANELLEQVHSCSSWGEWNADHARTWWRENGERVRALHRQEMQSAHSLSIAIDLDRRQPRG
jgi:serine/threonine-protein kinase